MNNQKVELDTYFFSPALALQEANKQNIADSIPGYVIKAKQVCYYAGDNRIPNAPENCIHVPLENFYNYFVTTRNRIPKSINFQGSEFNNNEAKELIKSLQEVIKIVQEERKKLTQIYAQKIQTNVPDFTDEKLRVFIPTVHETTVLKNVSKNIADAFERYGFEVLFYLPSELSSQDPLPRFHFLSEFNPHIIVTLNWFEQAATHEEVFRFCWFQDPVPLALDPKVPLALKKRDYLFSLNHTLDKGLLEKNIPEDRFFRQRFATNPTIFYNMKNIKRENKIVFIGRGYIFNRKHVKNEDLIYDELIVLIREGSINLDSIKQLSIKYEIDSDYVTRQLLPYVMRIELVEWICTQDKLKVEIYGSGWETHPNVMKHYKGEIDYGPNLAKIYNSAKYSIAGDLNYYYQQRLLEMSACGTIPLVYSINLENKAFEHEEHALMFKTQKELIENLNKEPKKNPEQIAIDVSYEKMAEKIDSLVTAAIEKETHAR